MDQLNNKAETQESPPDDRAETQESPLYHRAETQESLLTDMAQVAEVITSTIPPQPDAAAGESGPARRQHEVAQHRSAPGDAQERQAETAPQMGAPANDRHHTANDDHAPRGQAPPDGQESALKAMAAQMDALVHMVQNMQQRMSAIEQQARQSTPMHGPRKNLFATPIVGSGNNDNNVPLLGSARIRPAASMPAPTTGVTTPTATSPVLARTVPATLSTPFRAGPARLERGVPIGTDSMFARVPTTRTNATANAQYLHRNHDVTLDLSVLGTGLGILHFAPPDGKYRKDDSLKRRGGAFTGAGSPEHQVDTFVEFLTDWCREVQKRNLTKQAALQWLNVNVGGQARDFVEEETTLEACLRSLGHGYFSQEHQEHYVVHMRTYQPPQSMRPPMIARKVARAALLISWDSRTSWDCLLDKLPPSWMLSHQSDVRKLHEAADRGEHIDTAYGMLLRIEASDARNSANETTRTSVPTKAPSSRRSTSSGESTRRGSSKRCWKCQTYGHTAEQCEHAGRVCRMCKSPDHLARDCPKAAASTSGTTKRVNILGTDAAKKNGRRAAYIQLVHQTGTSVWLIDSGAETNAIDQMTAKELGLEIAPSAIKAIVMVNGKRVPVLGEVRMHTQWGTGTTVINAVVYEAKEPADCVLSLMCTDMQGEMHLQQSGDGKITPVIIGHELVETEEGSGIYRFTGISNRVSEDPDTLPTDTLSDFDIKSLPGKENVAADALPRSPIRNEPRGSERAMLAFDIDAEDDDDDIDACEIIKAQLQGSDIPPPFSEPEFVHMRKKVAKQAHDAPDGDDTYEIDKIVDEKKVDGIIHYKVCFRGYMPQFDRWVSEHVLQADELVSWWRSQQRANRRKGAKTNDKPRRSAHKNKPRRSAHDNNDERKSAQDKTDTRSRRNARGSNDRTSVNDKPAETTQVKKPSRNIDADAKHVDRIVQHMGLRNPRYLVALDPDHRENDFVWLKGKQILNLESALQTYHNNIKKT